MLNKITLVFLGLALACPLLAQEASDDDKDRLWVTDRLRLSLYQQADAQSQIIRYLSSGDLLEIEQLRGAYAFVTTSDGTKGWVKRGFLVSEPTSRLLLLDEQEKTRRLEAEIEKLGNSKIVIDQYEKDMDAMVEKIDTLEKENQQAAQSIADLREELEAREREAELMEKETPPATLVLWQTFTRYWKFVVPIVIVIVLLSFLVSKEIVEARIRNKFHGIKIW